MQASCVEATPDYSLEKWDIFNLRPASPWIVKLPLPQSRISVIVPVRNEAEALEKTLVALARQVDFGGEPIPLSHYEVIVFANNCTDGSAAVVQRFAHRNPDFQLHLIEQTLGAEEAYIGRVRQMLMNEAYCRRRWVGESGGIIASTDGDSEVDSQWIAAMLYEFERGADAVGGRTVTQRVERHALDMQTRSTYLRFVGYRYLIKQLEDYLDPDPFDCPPRHYQFFGANFAVTHEMYARAGGLPPVQTSEDVAFHTVLLRLGAKVRHSMLMRVTTSARQQGRATLGLADRLTQFQQMGQHQQAFLVEPAGAVEAKLLARRELRRYWQHYSSGQPMSALARQQLAGLAARLAVPLTVLDRGVEQSSSWVELHQQIDQCQQATGLWQQRWGSVAIATAVADLRLRLYQLRQQCPLAKAQG